MKQNKQEQWEKEFDKKFVGVVQVKSDSTAISYEPNHIWKEDKYGGYETMTQPYQVKQFISNLLSQYRQEAVEEERERIIDLIIKTDVDVFANLGEEEIKEYLHKPALSSNNLKDKQ